MDGHDIQTFRAPLKEADGHPVPPARSTHRITAMGGPHAVILYPDNVLAKFQALCSMDIHRDILTLSVEHRARPTAPPAAHPLRAPPCDSWSGMHHRRVE